MEKFDMSIPEVRRCFIRDTFLEFRFCDPITLVEVNSYKGVFGVFNNKEIFSFRVSSAKHELEYFDRSRFNCVSRFREYVLSIILDNYSSDGSGVL